MNDRERLKLFILHWRLKYQIDMDTINLIKKTAIFDLDERLIELTLPQGMRCPEEIMEFEFLQTLRIKQTVVDEETVETISGLGNLKNLSIRESHIVDINRIFALSQLRWLDISFCKLRHFPVKRTMNLTSLLLAGNEIHYLTPVGRFLPELKRLVLTFNPIESIGEEILGYPSLQFLILWSTNIREIVDSVWGRLKLIDLTNTPLGFFLSENEINGTKIVRGVHERYT